MTPPDCIDFMGERWNVVHKDARRNFLTLERSRRFFKGRLLAVGVEELYHERMAKMVPDLAAQFGQERADG